MSIAAVAAFPGPRSPLLSSTGRRANRSSPPLSPSCPPWRPEGETAPRTTPRTTSGGGLPPRCLAPFESAKSSWLELMAPASLPPPLCVISSMQHAQEVVEDRDIAVVAAARGGLPTARRRARLQRTPSSRTARARGQWGSAVATTWAAAVAAAMMNKSKYVLDLAVFSRGGLVTQKHPHAHHGTNTMLNLSD